MIQVAMTPDQFATMTAKLKAQQGIILAGNSGTLSAHGASGTWSYDGQKFTATVTHSPFPFSKSTAESHLKSWLTE
jgi:hypothetical protein